MVNGSVQQILQSFTIQLSENGAETVKILREAAVATVMVTHDPAEAELVGDRVSWLDACCSRKSGPEGSETACIRDC